MRGAALQTDVGETRDSEPHIVLQARNRQALPGAGRRPVGGAREAPVARKAENGSRAAQDLG